MSISDKQFAANRRNASRSTGPKTAEGKARSSQNATRHGLLSRNAVITASDCVPSDRRPSVVESQEDFDLHLERLRESLKPATEIEDLLVQQIAVCYWKMARHGRMDKQLYYESMRLTSILNMPLETFSTLQRYEGGLQRTLDRSLAHLERIQKSREEVEG